MLLLHTAATERVDSPANAARTAERIREEVPGAAVETHLIGVADPTEIATLAAWFDGVLRGLPAAGEVHICASSGTPQMGIALTLAAEQALPAARHWTALNPAEARPPYLREFEPDVLRHRREMAEALGLLACCHVFEARERFKARLAANSVPVRMVKGAVESGRRAAGALTLIGEFQVDAAARMLPPGNVAGKTLRGAPRLGPLAGWLANLKGATARNPAWAVELAALALREREVGRTALAVLRTAVAHEVMLDVRLQEKHEIDPDNLGREGRQKVERALGERAAEVIKEERFDGQGGRLKLPWWRERFDLIRALEPAVARRFDDGRREEIAVVTEMRNNLVHRGTLAGERAANPEGPLDAGLAYVRDLCVAFGWPDPADAPTAPRAVAALAGELAVWAGVAFTGAAAG